MEAKEKMLDTALSSEQWANYCKTGSCYVTTVELEFHHLMRDPREPNDLTKLAPTPSHASEVLVNDRSNLLLWLEDGSPAHARWSAAESMFRRIGDDAAIEIARVRAWSTIPFPVATS